MHEIIKKNDIVNIFAVKIHLTNKNYCLFKIKPLNGLILLNIHPFQPIIDL